MKYYSTFISGLGNGRWNLCGCLQRRIFSVGLDGELDQVHKIPVKAKAKAKANVRGNIDLYVEWSGSRRVEAGQVL